MYEKWDELEHQFRAETKQDAPPFGPGVLEWDYSRYTRALGFGKAPGLDNLRRRACVVASGRYAFRNDAARHLKRWGDDIGWDFVRMSARPSTLVPDPVIYQLGIEVTHPDSLIFCAAGQQGTPVVGKRPRSPAMRIPLTAAERWLIAANRVRRRVRCEIATRGLVLFIDDAEYLTPSALTTLSYLLDAQCAWKSHFLSSPAMVYIAFSLPAEHDGWFHDTLSRFNPRATPFRVRDPIGPITLAEAAKAPHLTVEEEHVADVLAEVEVALPVAFAADLVGVSVLADIVAGLESPIGQLRSVRDDVELVALTRSSHGSRMLPSSVRSHVSASRRRAMERGHPAVKREWLATRGYSCESLDGGSLGGAQSPELSMLMPLVHAIAGLGAVAGGTFECLLRRAALNIALCYDFDARRSFSELALRQIRTHGEFRALFRLMFWMGPHRMRRLVPDGFWASLKIQCVPSAVGDAACVLADMIAGLTRRKFEESVTRAQFALELLQENLGAQPGGWHDRSQGHQASGAGKFRTVLAPMALRARLILQASAQAVLDDDAALAEAERLCMSIGNVPAPVLGSIGYSLATSPVVGTAQKRWTGMFAQIRDLAAATGDLSAQLVVTSAVLVQLQRDRVSVLGVGETDELSILMGPRTDPSVRARMSRRVVDASDLPLPALATHCIQRAAGEHADCGGTVVVREVLELAQRLISSGELSAAARTIDSIGEATCRDTEGPSLVAFCRLQLGVCSVDKACVARGASELLTATQHFDTSSREVVASLTSAAGHVVRGQFGKCRTAALIGLRLVSNSPITRSRIAHNFLAWLVAVGTTMDRLFGQGAVPAVGELQSAIVRLDGCASLYGFGYSRATLCGSASRLEAAIPGIELFLVSGGRMTATDTFRYAVELRRSVRACLDWSDRDIVLALQRSAPSYFNALANELVGFIGTALGETSALVESSLRILDEMFEDEAWLPSGRSRMAEKNGGVLVHGVSAARAARLASSCWRWDGALWRGLRRSELQSVGTGGVVEIRGAGQIGSSSILELERTERFCLLARGTTVRRWVHMPSTLLSLETLADLTDFLAPSRTGASGVGRNERRRPLDAWIGDSDASAAIREHAARAARAHLPVLILGESGTGKELLARIIRRLSTHAKGPTVVVDCGAIVDELLEVELFGSAVGAYTSSVGERVGLLEAADGGTIILDRVCDMSPRMQGCLLRVLESGEYRRVGDDDDRRSTFRLISLARMGLGERVDRGVFRQDLYYRIGGFPIEIPPLRLRPSDSVAIANSVIVRSGGTLTSEALSAIELHTWPGNVRELMNVLSRISIGSTGGAISVAAVREAIEAARSPGAAQCVEATPRRATRHGRLSGESLTKLMPPVSQFRTGEYASYHGVSRRTAQRQLAQLLKIGAIVRCGAGRATHYMVLKRTDTG